MALTEDQKKFIRDNYQKMIYKELAAAVGKTESSIANFLHKEKLKLLPQEYQKRHQASLFKKGQVSWNKGLSLPNIPNSGQFKKGSVPKNTKPKGTVTMRPHKRSGEKYLYIKISNNNWKLLHQYNWELVNGPVPKKHVLRFKDKNTLNCNIENLELITQAKNIELNRNYKYDRIKSDKIVAGYITRDPELRKEVLKYPELIEIKRQQLKLKKVLNETKRQAI